MRTPRRATIRDLRLAIDCLPRSTRIAMLDGIGSNEIIVGAYSDAGGVCPMLAAHRAGGRTSFISFARAWDRLAFRDAGGGARRATERELLILRTHLEASLLEEDACGQELAEAVAEHRALLARRGRRADQRARMEGDAAPADRTDAGARRAEHATPHRALADRTEAGTPRPGDPDRSGELRRRPGWAWMRVFRRYEDYQRALERVYAESDELKRRDELERRDERELV